MLIVRLTRLNAVARLRGRRGFPEWPAQIENNNINTGKNVRLNSASDINLQATNNINLNPTGNVILTKPNMSLSSVYNCNVFGFGLVLIPTPLPQFKINKDFDAFDIRLQIL